MHTVDYSFGTWIKRRRKALDLTQQQLAQRVGCSVSLIFKIESDARHPSRQIAELLAQHLEIPAEQRELFLKVARQEKAIEVLESLPPPSETIEVPRPSQPNLPAPLTSLVGREHELQMIIQQLQDPTCRLLTLTGPGGVGKTRLAQETAQQLHETSYDGAYFVSLAGTSTSEFIIPAIADALGLSFSGSIELKAQLFNFLSAKQILLVLDNLEHLLDGVELLDELLQSAPGVKLLATSREPLSLRSEWVFEVQGLPIPSRIELENIEANSAAALFIERARQVKLIFTPAPEDLPAIARICQLVEGLPLGLELAATWITTLTCSEIAAEIEQNLDFLATSRRDLPERHRSLHAVFDYSWNLLSSEEQAVLKALSVFQGGFQRDAAEQVAGATLWLLLSLMSKSFLRRNESGRYGQHELVRQYAALHLHQDLQNEASARGRHAAHYLILWGEGEGGLKGSQQREIMQKLIAEIDNFRAAWDWGIAQGQLGLIGKCLRAFLLVYDLRGLYTEGMERTGSLVRLLLSERDSQHQYADVLSLASALQGWFQFRLGQLAEARASFEQALIILRTLDSPLLSVDVLSLFSPLMTSMGETEQALQYVGEGLSAARSSGDTWRIAYCLMMQGGILASSGRNDEAYASSQEALTYFRTLGDIRLIMVTLNTLGFVAIQLSRYSEARQFLQESLTLVTPAEDPWSVGTAYGNLGIVELLQGNASDAQVLLQKSISLFTNLGMLGDVAVYLTHLGEAFAALGALHEAERHWLDSIRIAHEAQAVPVILASLVRLARLHAEKGDVTRAYEWVVWVANHPAAWQDSKSRAEKLRGELRKRLSTQQLQAISIHAPTNFPDQLVREMLAGQR